ncbi:DNA/RNA helicase domain-containing protein [Rhodohalobacter sp.]|uniref:DNA/RNA helicase domain-containing protein n=1 Tax=Rhodohalobacter sp. TaxID=1974210 RepID=UPI002ACF05D1|nr:DNA/RNA helicase domain-containing protein [Rhodohalobacter sp.]MDZ7758098.1 DNA/RNA helicase domain-containing protein [Rhodohalobacter sp.]
MKSQRVHIHDIGENGRIRKWAEKAGAEIIETELSSQFRCNGSDGYMAWLDHALQIRETANTDLEGIDFDFRVLSSPNEVFDLIKVKNRETNKSRMVAGYCWDWNSKKNPDEMDIVIPEHDFAKKWNLADDGMLWLIKEESINEIGCIHTCQGLELDYVGVIIGPDFKIRDGEAVTDAYERSSNDRSIFGIKKMMKEEPEKAKDLAETIIKNTYRTLMSRGMKGCYIYCTDKETEEYFRKMVVNMNDTKT